MNTFKKTTLALAVFTLASGAIAQTAPAPAPAPTASPITANITITNDYRYRGISQSNFLPAIQGGFDYAHESGFYIGNWNSSISWLSDYYGNGGGGAQSGLNVTAPVEMDFYAGFKKELIAPGFASDVGVLQYFYPSKGIPVGNGTAFANPNTTEVYLAQNFTFGPLTGFVKFSYAMTTTFGNVNSRGSYYPDLTINYDTGILGITANGHVGYQYIAGTVDGISNDKFSYTDWKLGLTKDFGGGVSAAIAYVGTNAKKVGSTYSYGSPQGKDLGSAGGLISLTKTF
jgi:uncharacterized protein (TIGR02001 family)